MKEAYSALRVHLNTFKLLEEKTAPSLVDKFGWCTWDAFYLTLEPAGVWHGVNDFVEGGVTPRFLIIDDGWQSINTDDGNPNEDAKNLVLGGTQMTARLHRLDDCEKFRKYKGGSMLGPNPPSFDPKKPKMLISKAIELEHAEKDRDQAIQSGVTDLSPFEARIQKLKQELDTLFGGEEKSVSSGSYSCKAEGSTNLNSKIISCKLSPGLDGTMTDLAVVKIVEGGIDLVHPDQAGDFYDSMHSYLCQCWHYRSESRCHSYYRGRVELAKFHAGSRAICGGPVYVSDSVGGHDFELLRKLVHPDGTIPRCQDFALPTRDCLFRNPLFEKKTILKIWNFNKKKEAARMRRAEEFIVYLSQAEDLLHASPQSEAIQITIQPSSFEIFSFVPIKKLGTSIDFAPVGLTDMFNSGGTIQELEYFDSELAETRVKIEVKGGGNFLSYSTASPKKGFLNGAEVAFEWLDNGRLTLNFPWAETAGGISHVVFASCLVV
ncbi:hypothetical protein OIU74_011479 [Salix koriyanagi]|uniref:Stachyose synthase n=1 Tax=Salix koriyanagi TaxID=2511006 RepID=A0A9Q0TFF5_9ROSI|nr:hypothetical protein OIU74_011479 [Salix koriyanagi]